MSPCMTTSGEDFAVTRKSLGMFAVIPFSMNVPYISADSEKYTLIPNDSNSSITYEYLHHSPAAQKPSHPVPPTETLLFAAPNAAVFQPSSATFVPDMPPENVFAAFSLTALLHVAEPPMSLSMPSLILAPVTEMPPGPDITPEKSFVTPECS